MSGYELELCEICGAKTRYSLIEVAPGAAGCERAQGAVFFPIAMTRRLYTERAVERVPPMRRVHIAPNDWPT